MRAENERMTLPKFQSHLIALFAEAEEMPLSDWFAAMGYAHGLVYSAFRKMERGTGEVSAREEFRRPSNWEIGNLKQSIDSGDT